MSQEKFPLHLEGVVIGFLFRHFLPAIAEFDRLFNIGIPDGLGRASVVLDLAPAQASHGTAVGTINMQSQQVVAINAGHPAAVEMGDNVPLQFEGGVSRVISGTLVGIALLVDSLGYMGRPMACDGLPRRKDCPARSANGRACRR